MAAIKLYNFLTRKKEVFKPLKKGRVGFYTCGPTVYNYAHIGNLRTYIFEDVLRRSLEYGGYKVKHVMNITDVDDKIIKNSLDSGKTIFEFAKPYEEAFYGDLEKLNIKKAWKYPKATKHIEEMLDIIQALLKKKLAYKIEGSVYFDVSKFKKYGKLSQLKKQQLKAGARIDSDEYEKGSAEDFVLWKAVKPGEPSWSSPYGKGRPGWHLECSAMSMKYLGKSFDIHAGGIDLLFPHHENEIAQSEGATNKRFVKHFVEGEHLLVDGKKMAKSLGNVFTLRDIEEKKIDPISFRYLVLSANYRKPLNFTWESLQAAQNSLERLNNFISELNQKLRMKFSGGGEPSRNSIPTLSAMGLRKFQTQFTDFRKKFEAAIFNDLDMPKAIAVVWDLIHKYNKSASQRAGKYNADDVLKLLYEFDKVLGLGFEKIIPSKPPAEALKLLEERETARKSGDFSKADQIREEIRRLGWRLSDTKEGSQLFPL